MFRYLSFIVKLLILLVCIAPTLSFAGSFKAISVAKNGTDVTIVVELAKPIAFTAETLQSPFRLELTLNSVLESLPKKLAGKDDFKLISLRAPEDGKTTVVFETQSPVLIKSARFEKDTGRIKIELVSTDQETFETFLKLKAKEAAVVAEALPAIVTPDVVQPLPSLPTAYDAKRVIVIDAGHGGIDPGAVSKSGTKEKDVVFAFANSLKKVLETRSNFRVVLSRPDDKFVSLPARVKFAQGVHADLFISLHADTLRGKSARGATFYTLSDEASDSEAAALAQKENRVDEVAGINFPEENEEIADILVELVRRESKNHANYFASKAAERVGEVAHLTGKPVRSADFAVLTAPDIPSVLVELGFLSSAEDERLLKDAKWREKTANALAAAVEEYLSEEVAVNSISRAATAPQKP